MWTLAVAADMVSDTRLYGAAIASASGLYSVWSATTAARMVPGSWLMLALGVVVLVHGGVLLTDAADRFGGASGPLMVVYAAAMLLNQALLAAGVLDDGSPVDGGTGGGMDGGMGDGGMSGGMGGDVAAGMGWDPGMVALAALMLASGLIMARGAAADSGGM
jgi:hypothetical protein